MSAGQRWTDWKSFSTNFLRWVFLCLLRKQFHHLSSVFWQTHLVPCCLQELWICYDTKRYFSVNSNASESNCIALPPSFCNCLPERDWNFSRHFICELGLLWWFLPSLQDESRTLFNCCKNQSKKILFIISEPFLEYRTIPESIAKNNFSEL